MNDVTLRPVDIERDFPRMADLFTTEQDEPTTVESLRADYDAHKARIFCLMAAQDTSGELLGFNWATINRANHNEAYFYVIVRPEWRGQGIGALLYAELEQAAPAAQIHKLVVSVRDHLPHNRAFAEAHGFSERNHSIGMQLDLIRFNDLPYQPEMDRLRVEGFHYSNMEALGDTEDSQRRLYALNDSAAADTPGSEGVHPWLSFEDFREKVCHSDWYLPAGQMVVIDQTSGDWAAMSAITRFTGADYAYNLFTGTDRRYRGRKLAQTVKVLALRFAREVLDVQVVKTHHNAQNAAMIAIDRKLGYTQTPGFFRMEKTLE